MSALEVFWIEVVPPFRLDLTVWALRRQPSNTVDRWDGQTYRRVLMLAGDFAEVAVVQSEPPDSARLRVTLKAPRIAPDAHVLAATSLERLLGLRHDLTAFYRLAGSDSKLGPLVERFRGLKPPRFPTLFEALANAVSCQQLSLSFGVLLLNRLTEKFGKSEDGTPASAHAFPRPEDLANLEPMAFRPLGFSRQKGYALANLARACVDHEIDLESMEKWNDQQILERLLQLRGVGRWSAEYALLRGLGRLNVFPGDDVGARNNLQRWLNLSQRLDYDDVRRITAPWQPHAGFLYFLLLLDRLQAAGHVAV